MRSRLGLGKPGPSRSRPRTSSSSLSTVVPLPGQQSLSQCARPGPAHYRTTPRAVLAESLALQVARPAAARRRVRPGPGGPRPTVSKARTPAGGPGQEFKSESYPGTVTQEPRLPVSRVPQPRRAGPLAGTIVP
eukprot:1028253-Rhodomonas_salina.4